MAQDQHRRNRNYLAAIAMLSDMMARNLIDADDYCARLRTRGVRKSGRWPDRGQLNPMD